MLRLREPFQNLDLRIISREPEIFSLVVSGRLCFRFITAFLMTTYFILTNTNNTLSLPYFRSAPFFRPSLSSIRIVIN